jgi:hypothetical protein
MNVWTRHGVLVLRNRSTGGQGPHSLVEVLLFAAQLVAVHFLSGAAT